MSEPSAPIVEKAEALGTPKVIPSDPHSPHLSLRELARAHASRLARLLRHLGVPSADLEDAVQDVFLIAHRKMGTAEVLEPEAWLRGVALNVARNRTRALRRSPVDFRDEVPEAIDARTPEREAEVSKQRALLTHCLALLSEEQRTALVLFELEGVPMKEVAQHLGCSLPSAYRHVTEAQAFLKRAVAGAERGGRR